MLIVARFAGKFGLQQVNFLLSDNKKLVTLLQRQRASPVISKGIGLHDQLMLHQFHALKISMSAFIFR